MININFVPEDYLQNSESQRTNLMYLLLLAIVMIALGASFMTIKIRQKALIAKEKIVNTKMTQAQESIKKFEALQAKRKIMLKTALTTAELIEPVPRSILLASLTNNLPTGVSLLRLNLIQKQPKNTNSAVATSKYNQEQAKKNASQEDSQSPSAIAQNPEKFLETHMDIEGIAPSDLQVAAYIEQLCDSSLLDNVALVESKEHKIEDTTFRQFKLTAMLRKTVHLSDQDIEKIRAKGQNVARSF